MVFKTMVKIKASQKARFDYFNKGKSIQTEVLIGNHYLGDNLYGISKAFAGIVKKSVEASCLGVDEEKAIF